MSNKNQGFLKFSWIILGMIFLVILAGGIVRMTQSGMGCPDWPKCFGSWIPPTDASQLPPDFEKYLDKQDIDHTFNVYHTWIEYINRLLGAILGVLIFIYFIWSIVKFWGKDKLIVLGTFLLLVITGFQGWTGKLVVDANLHVVKVTMHMLISLVIAAIPLLIINRLNRQRVMVPKVLKITGILLLISVLAQIILGTQVREEIDIVSKALSYQQRDLWIDGLGTVFYIHRSFSWVILALAGYLWYKTRDFVELRVISNFILFCVLVAIIAGIAMNYYNVPAIAQPIHLVVAGLLCMSTFYYRIRLI